MIEGLSPELDLDVEPVQGIDVVPSILDTICRFNDAAGPGVAQASLIRPA